MGPPTAWPSSHGLLPRISFTHNGDHLRMYFYHRWNSNKLDVALNPTKHEGLKAPKPHSPQRAGIRGRQTLLLTGPPYYVTPRQSCVQSANCGSNTSSHPAGQWPPGAWLFLQHATTPFLPCPPCRVTPRGGGGATKASEEGAVPSLSPGHPAAH